MLDAGADKEAKGNDGKTALMLAPMAGHESCVRALLDASADKDTKDNDGMTALMAASGQAVVTLLSGWE